MKTLTTLITSALLLAACDHPRPVQPVPDNGTTVEPRPNPDGSQK